MGVKEADQITDALNNVMNGTFNRLLKLSMVLGLHHAFFYCILGARDASCTEM